MSEPFPQYRYGILMAVLTVISWGLVPVLLKFLTTELSAINIAWFRLMFGGVAFFFWARARGSLAANTRGLVAFAAVLAGVCFAYHYAALFRAVELGGPALA
ncbi:MAG: EamA family transporter, partial [Bdellovibrionales bacterium]|nr:EamA family transporter [Bdellovibrionales bacterium]